MHRGARCPRRPLPVAPAWTGLWASLDPKSRRPRRGAAPRRRLRRSGGQPELSRVTVPRAHRARQHDLREPFSRTPSAGTKPWRANMRSIRTRLLTTVIATGVVALAAPVSGASAAIPTFPGFAGYAGYTLPTSFPSLGGAVSAVGGNQIGTAGCVGTNRPSVGGNNGSTSAQTLWRRPELLRPADRADRQRDRADDHRLPERLREGVRGVDHRNRLGRLGPPAGRRRTREESSGATDQCLATTSDRHGTVTDGIDHELTATTRCLEAGRY